jgi:hypothetical protein
METLNSLPKLPAPELFNLNDLPCPFYNLSARTLQKTILVLLRVFVYAETRLLSFSIATAVRVTSRIVTPLLLRAAITWQRLFLWLHSSCLEQIRRNM